MTDRTAGEGRYAHVEREQRWVLAGCPDDLGHPVSIDDLYIADTRLRLRRMTAKDGVTYKLGQKVRRQAADPEWVKLTNMYLSEGEYQILARLKGPEIRKTRRPWTTGPRTLVVDVFEGALAGLIMAEVELADEEPKIEPPPSALYDATDDDRFSGGRLAVTTADELQTLLTEIGRSPWPG
jgi:CYTH domain-containing protein